MKEIQEDKKVENGYNTVQLKGLMETLIDNPQAGNVTFLCNSYWQDGARTFNHFSGYRIDGQRYHEEERKFVVLSDEPSEFGASDAAPAPAEQLLGAVSGCITATTNAFASLHGVALEKLEVTVEGDVNLQGMFALREDVPIGFHTIRTSIRIAGNASESSLKKMAELGFNYSPMRNTVSSKTSAELNIQITS